MRQPMNMEDVRPQPVLPRPPRPLSYERFIRVGMVAWAVVGIALAGFVLLRLVGATRVLLPPVLIAGGIVYLLNPLVSALARRGVPRVAGALIVYLGFLLIAWPSGCWCRC